MRPSEVTNYKQRYVDSRMQIYRELMACKCVAQFRMTLDLYATKMVPLDYVMLFCQACLTESSMLEHILAEIEHGTYFDTLVRNAKFIKAFIDTMFGLRRGQDKFAKVYATIKAKFPDVERLQYVARRKRKLDALCGTQTQVSGGK